jgi:hypothetical protein
MKPILLVVFTWGCVSAPGVTIQGEVDATMLADRGPRDLAIIYSPEDADHSLRGQTTVTEFPSSFALHTKPPHSAFETYGGVDGTAGELYFANTGTFGDADDGFGTDGSMRLAGYTLIYLDAPPKSAVFGRTDLEEGWNLLRMAEVTCDDAVDLGGGAIGWPAKYDLIPLDSTLRIVVVGELELQSWEPPFHCP